MTEVYVHPQRCGITAVREVVSEKIEPAVKVPARSWQISCGLARHARRFSMAHFPKPFFRPARALWYVQIDGKQINLGSDKAAAFKAYHGLMQQRADAKPYAPTT